MTSDTTSPPGLHLHTGNRLESLVRALAGVTRAPLGSPFRAETIVVQSQGMARWLRLELARHHGVCAHVEFPFPKAFVAQVFRAVLPDWREASPFEPEVMTWRVMKALPGLLDQPAFAPLAHYLGDGRDARKLVQLSGRIAHLFDQYLIFRPAWMEEWSAGRVGGGWQAELWRTLASPEQPLHPAARLRELAKALEAGGKVSPTFPERVAIFGISALPPFYVELLAVLARRIPVHLFLLQPSQEYWGDITSSREDERILRQTHAAETHAFELHLESGNRLLASLGYLGRDFLKLLLGVGDWIGAEDFTDPGETSLLACIQSDILHLRDRGRNEGGRTRLPAQEPGWGRPVPTEAAGTSRPHPVHGNGTSPPPTGDGGVAATGADDSIQIHSCHSPLREMEVLHDHLLAWFERDPRLAPRDVVVMMPDIETYAPFVQAVFGTPEDDAKRIPFSLADRGPRRQSQVVETFLQILHLPGTRLGAATALAPLETRAVREKFQLAEGDLELIRGWVEQTHTHWGIDAVHRARLKLPALPAGTWRDGLRRLLLGYAMAGHGERMFGDVLPFDDIEGGAAVVLGHFVEYAERLFATVDALALPRRLDEWAAFLVRLLEDFFHSDDETERELLAIRTALEELRRSQQLAGFNEAVGLAVVLEQLAPMLEEDRFGSGFLTGGVTFCGLKPMRSIPFQIICLVGMNDNAFPRPVGQLSFDWMAQKPLLGDRSSREDDRYLFLETILSARQRLYVSYVGQSIRDNRAAPPSVLVSELLDYIEQGFEMVDEEGAASSDAPPLSELLITRHRLQAFSPAYFNASDPHLFSYSAENCLASRATVQRQPLAAPFLAAPLSEPEATFRALTLDDLAAFLCNPAKFLLNRRLNILLRDDASELDERETFHLNNLDSYKLKQSLVERKLAAPAMKAGLALVQAAGGLPLGHVGEVDFHAARAGADRFWTALQRHQPERALPPLDVDLALGEFRLTGRVALITPAGLLGFRCATIKPADLLKHWVRHLAMNAVQPAASVLVGEGEERAFAPCEDAADRLQELLAFYWRGLSIPQKFFPKSSLAFAEATHRLARGSKAKTPPLELARRAWEGNEQSDAKGEGEEAHFQLCFRNSDPLDEEFQKLAKEIFGPILNSEVDA